MRTDDLIFVAGHKGLVGSAIVRTLLQAGYTNLVVVSRKSVNLLNQERTFSFLQEHRPKWVLVAAARVGGIVGNKNHPADFLYENLQIQNNLIHGSFKAGVEKLLFLGSSCIYPKYANQPIVEDSLLTGSLEPTNEPYAVAKIAGIKLCQAYAKQYGKNFISCMPTNLYGPGDNFNVVNGHVIPSLLRKIYEAKQQGLPTVPCYGTGNALREFLYVDDLASACLFLMQNYDDTQSTINVGSGEEITIRALADLLVELVGYTGELVWDSSKPDGTPRKLVDSSKIRNLGWAPKVTLAEGLQRTLNWYKKHYR